MGHTRSTPSLQRERCPARRVSCHQVVWSGVIPLFSLPFNIVEMMQSHFWQPLISPRSVFTRMKMERVLCTPRDSVLVSSHWLFEAVWDGRDASRPKSFTAALRLTTQRFRAIRPMAERAVWLLSASDALSFLICRDDGQACVYLHRNKCLASQTSHHSAWMTSCPGKLRL